MFRIAYSTICASPLSGTIAASCPLSYGSAPGLKRNPKKTRERVFENPSVFRWTRRRPSVIPRSMNIDLLFDGSLKIQAVAKRAKIDHRVLGQALAGKAVLNGDQLVKLAAALDSDADTVRARLKRVRSEYEATNGKKVRK